MKSLLILVALLVGAGCGAHQPGKPSGQKGATPTPVAVTTRLVKSSTAASATLAFEIQLKAAVSNETQGANIKREYLQTSIDNIRLASPEEAVRIASDVGHFINSQGSSSKDADDYRTAARHVTELDIIPEDMQELQKSACKTAIKRVQSALLLRAEGLAQQEESMKSIDSGEFKRSAKQLIQSNSSADAALKTMHEADALLDKLNREAGLPTVIDLNLSLSINLF